MSAATRSALLAPRRCSGAEHSDTWAGLNIHEKQVATESSNVATMQMTASMHLLTNVTTGTFTAEPGPPDQAGHRASRGAAPRREGGVERVFLRSRRARLKPADVGLPEYGRRRRVPGLRREELAQLAGVSAADYTRLEQGNGRNVSRAVLDAISTALKLSDTGHAHLLHLVRPGPRRRTTPVQRQQVRPVLREMLTAIENVPAYVWGRRTDMLAWNHTASALFGDCSPTGRPRPGCGSSNHGCVVSAG